MGSAPSVTLLPFEAGGVVAGKYRLRRRLAAGGAGEVWVARNEATRAKVALKVLRRGTTATLDAIERFRQEARIGGMLSHRNIVRVFDLIEQEDGTLVLVMELLAGETLASYLKRRAPLRPREAVGICLPILAALRHAHEQKILHRDISPRNIFLVVEPDGHVVAKLVDFGLAKAPAWEFKTVEGSVLGTPSYMSPEQIRAEPVLDGRTDVYGVAAVLYEMLTASPPFRGPNPMATLVAALEGDGPEPRAIDERLWPVVKAGLARARADRPADAQEFAAMLTLAVSGTDAVLAAELNHTSAVMVGDEIHDELSSLDNAGSASESGAVARAGARSAVATAFGNGLAQSLPRGRVAVPVAAIVALAVVAAIAIVSLATVAARNVAGSPPLQASPAGASPTVNASSGALAAGRGVNAAPATEVAPGPTALPSPAAPSSSSPPAFVPAAAQAAKPRPVATTPGF